MTADEPKVVQSKSRHDRIVNAEWRWQYLLLACVLCICCGGAVFGFSILEGPLADAGAFQGDCSEPGCEEQRLAIGTVYTIASVSAFVFALFMGGLLDTYGPKVTIAIATGGFSVGAVLVAVSLLTNTWWLLYPGIAMFGIMSQGIIAPLVPTSNLFPGSEAMVISVINGSFDGSVLVFLCLKEMGAAGSSTLGLEGAFFVYAGVCAALCAIVIVIWPGEVFLPNEIDDVLPGVLAHAISSCGEEGKNGDVYDAIALAAKASKVTPEGPRSQEAPTDADTAAGRSTAKEAHSSSEAGDSASKGPRASHISEFSVPDVPALPDSRPSTPETKGGPAGPPGSREGLLVEEKQTRKAWGSSESGSSKQSTGGAAPRNLQSEVDQSPGAGRGATKEHALAARAPEEADSNPAAAAPRDDARYQGDGASSGSAIPDGETEEGEEEERQDPGGWPRFLETMQSPVFLGYALFFATNSLFYNYYFLTLGTRLQANALISDGEPTELLALQGRDATPAEQDALDEAASQAGRLLDIFGVLLPACAVVVFATGYIMDTAGLVYAFHGLVVVALAFQSLAMIPDPPMLQLATFVLFALFRAFLFGSLGTFLITQFGAEIMGKLVAVVVPFGGLVSLLQYPLFQQSMSVYRADFTVTSASLLGLAALSVLFPIGFGCKNGYKCRYRKLQEEREAKIEEAKQRWRNVKKAIPAGAFRGLGAKGVAMAVTAAHHSKSLKSAVQAAKREVAKSRRDLLAAAEEGGSRESGEMERRKESGDEDAAAATAGAAAAVET